MARPGSPAAGSALSPSAGQPVWKGYLVVAVMLLTSATTCAIPYTSFGLLAEQWVSEFDVPRSDMMFALLALTVAVGLISLPAGRLIDKRPPMPIVATGLAGFALGYFLLSLATAPWQVIVLHATLLPLGLALSGVMSSQILGARWFPGRRGLIMGIMASGMALGGIFYPPIIAALLRVMDWRTTVSLLAAGGLVVLLPLVLVCIRNPSGKISASTSQSSPPGAEFTAREILAEPLFWMVSAVYLGSFIAATGFQANVVGFAADKGLSFSLAAGLLSIFSLTVTAGRFVWGYLADKFERRVILMVLCAVNAGSYVLLTLTQGGVAVGLSVALLGLSAGGMQPVVLASLSTRFQNSFGRAYGLFALALPFGSIGAPYIAAAEHAWGSYTPVLLSLAALIIACAVPLAIFPQVRKAQTAAQ